jgi:electron-transferring-flavoprotein dehydrogenase
MLIGDSAGFVNVARLKGIHTAMKSAMTAAECIHRDHFKNPEVSTYPQQLKQTWLWSELYEQRNIRPAFKYGLWPGLSYSAVDSYILKGRAPWTFKLKADYQSLQQKGKKIPYPKPDNQISFDKLSSVYLSNTQHKENQPCHLQLKDPQQAITVNYHQYGSPEVYYCPAGVYELIEQANGEKSLQINSANCLHCKACDIKDPGQNIHWTPPEGGDGPNYGNL